VGIIVARDTSGSDVVFAADVERLRTGVRLAWQRRVRALLADHEIWLDHDGKDGRRFAMPGADLAGIDLTGARLTRADLRRADLTNSRLQGVHLQDAQLDRAKLVGVDAGGAIFTRASLRKADLTRANLRGARFDEVSLEGAQLQDADLHGANLTGTRLEGGRGTPLVGAPVTGFQPGVFKGGSLRTEGDDGPEVFLSSATTDQSITDAVMAELNSRGLRVWWDRSRVPGVDWVEETSKVRTRAAAGVVVWSTRSSQSASQQQDVEALLARKVPMIVVRVRGVPLPKELETLLTVDVGGRLDDRVLASLRNAIAGLADEIARQRPS
jgi:uncharacterized protein YjbI with pentapeptide repeats